MAIYAIIEQQTVVNMVISDTPVHNSLEAHAWTRIGDVLVNGALPPEPTAPQLTKEEALTAKLAEVMSGYSAAFAPIEAMYPSAEREGWPMQEAEAKALRDDPQAETPVLSALVHFRARGETVSELAAKVLANASEWRTLYARLTGMQQRMYSEVSALAEPGNPNTAADILAYPVTYAMPVLRAASARIPAPTPDTAFNQTSEYSENARRHEEIPESRQYPQYKSRKAPIRLPLMRSSMRGGRRV